MLEASWPVSTVELTTHQILEINAYAQRIAATYSGEPTEQLQHTYEQQICRYENGNALKQSCPAIYKMIVNLPAQQNPATISIINRLFAERMKVETGGQSEEHATTVVTGLLRTAMTEAVAARRED